MSFVNSLFSKKDKSGIDSNETVTDIEGNVYHTVKIGKQVWMVENMRVTKYLNGDTIPHLIEESKWLEEGYKEHGAYCFYHNDLRNAQKYGYLYNWFAIVDPRGFCPPGWHIPTNEEWMTLIDYLGGEDSDAGGKMKEVGTAHWKAPNDGATNKTGFSALPGGYRYFSGNAYCGITRIGYWWSLTEYDSAGAWSCELEHDSSYVKIGRAYGSKTSGFSVRCVKDN